MRTVTQIPSPRQENQQFRLLYAVGMIIIVSTHCGGGGLNLFYDWFPDSAFQLGLFTFASGYFYRSVAESHPLRYIGRKVLHLLVPLLLWNLAYAFFIMFLKTKGFSIGSELSLYTFFVSPWNDGHQFKFTMAGWYIAPLFMIQAFHVLFRKCAGRMGVGPWGTSVFYLLLGMGGVTLASWGVNTGFWLTLARFLYLLPFYGFGMLYKEKLERHDRLPGAIYFAILFAVQLTVVTFYGHTIGYSPSWCNNFNNGPVTPYLVGILGIAFWLRVCRILAPAASKSRLLSAIGKNTFTIMLNHFLGFFLVNSVFALLHRELGMCQDFDFAKYQSDIWFLYLPGGLKQWRIVYLAAGIGVSLGLAYLLKGIKCLVQQILPGKTQVRSQTAIDNAVSKQTAGNSFSTEKKPAADSSETERIKK